MDTPTTFVIYSHNCVLDIESHYSKFVSTTSELVMALRSRKRGWIEAMLRQAHIQTLDLPKIILSHWDNDFMQSYASHNYPELLRCVYSLYEDIERFKACSKQIMGSSYRANSNLYHQCMYCVIRIYRNTRYIYRKMRSIVEGGIG